MSNSRPADIYEPYVWIPPVDLLGPPAETRVQREIQHITACATYAQFFFWPGATLVPGKKLPRLRHANASQCMQCDTRCEHRTIELENVR